MKPLGSVVIGGGTGFIGSHLCKLLRNKGYDTTVISRMPGAKRLTWHQLNENGLPKGTTAVVNLAGQNVLDPTRSWTPGFKQNVFSSRINTTQSLADAVLKAEDPPSVFITISGVGIYKPDPEKEYTEDSSFEEYDFLSRLCIEWEKAGRLPEELDCRHVIIRSGVVLGRAGGMIKNLYLPFYLGLGGPVGNGRQYLPWIHINDITRLILFSIEEQNVKGVLNGVAPQVITNKEFSKAFARAMWRPSLFPVPKILLNFLLNKERANMLTEGQRVIPKRVLEYGFQYDYPDIESACKEVVASKRANVKSEIPPETTETSESLKSEEVPKSQRKQ